MFVTVHRHNQEKEYNLALQQGWRRKIVQAGIDAIVQKVNNRFPLLGTGRQYTPEPFHLPISPFTS
jgi:hypothetical protein